MSSILKVDTIQTTGGNDLITTGSNTTSLKNPNGTTGLTIDSSGFVAPKVPVLSVSLTSNTTTYSSNNFHLVDWSAYGQVDFDNTSAWNSANEKWTPQTAGYYNVNCTLTAGAGHIRAAGPVLYKNGSIYQQGVFWLGAEADGDDIQSSFSTLIHLNGSTDYIQMYGYIYDSVAGNDVFISSERKTSMTAHFVSS